MVKTHDDDVLGRPGFVSTGMRRPSQDHTIVEPSGHKDAFEVVIGSDALTILIDAHRYEPEEITVSEERETERLVVSGKRHETRAHGVFPGQEFTQKFPMPANASLKDMKKQYGANGVLEIVIPIKK